MSLGRSVMRIPAPFRTLALLGMMTAPAQAEPFFRGKTLIVDYVVRQSSCVAGESACEELQATGISSNVYFGKQGGVFDYSDGKVGFRKQVGVTDPNTGQRWDLKGNNAIVTASGPYFTTTYTYTPTGSGGCTLDIRRRMKPGHTNIRFIMRAEIRSCQIVDGLRER